MNNSKRNIAYIILTVLLSIAFLTLAYCVFPKSYIRIGESFIDFGQSIKYYFCTLFQIPNECTVSIIEYSDVFNQDTLIPNNKISFDYQKEAFFALFINKNNLVLWKNSTLELLGKISKAFVIIMPILMLLGIIIKMIYERPNNKYNHDTKPLFLYKKAVKAIILPIKNFFIGYFSFVEEKLYITIPWIIIWILNLNFGTILIEFLAFYFYFAVSFDIAHIYTQIVKLFVDLQVFFDTVPIPFILFFALFFYESWRARIATERLRHYEAKNCGFINELPIVSMTCGSMGKKKTTIITDMALSQEVMFRQEALERLQKTDMKFPYFPWISFEKELQKCMEYGKVYNLASCKEWVRLKESRYKKHGNVKWQLYGYDIVRYGMYYNDKLKEYSLFDIMETYAMLYFVYVIESSLLVTNYSIREDNILLDQGNFPIWNMDFFRKNGIENSHHSHILDFDILRLGKKVIENNPKTGSFEFGVVVITEVGKERGNNLELKEQKKNVEETNQKNDLFNSWLKMCRHSATIDNFPFIKVFTDEQRPESWGADARDLCDIVTVINTAEQSITYPCYTIEELISEWLFNRFIKLYYDFRFIRGDNTLLIYLLKQITSKLYNHNIRIYNSFGYSIVSIETERGTRMGKKNKRKYYLCNKKIYSDRFSTDCFSDFFNDMAKKTKVSFANYKEYQTSKATVHELKEQNSYFIDALYKNTKGGDTV